MTTKLQLVDTFAHHNDLLAQMREDYRAWKNLQTQVKTFQQKVAENEAKKQLLQYQVEELDEFALRPNDIWSWKRIKRRLSNSEQLTQLSQSALQLLSENETVSIDSMLYRATQYIDELSELDPRYASVQTMLNDALIQVQEATSEVQHLASHIEQDPMLLQEIEQRLGQALQLARKHNVKPEELVEWHQKLKAELTALLKPVHEATREFVAQPIGKATDNMYSYLALVQDDPTIQIVNQAQKAYVEKVAPSVAAMAGLPILSAGAPFKAGGRKNDPTAILKLTKVN